MMAAFRDAKLKNYMFPEAEVVTEINVGGVKGLRGIGYLKGIDELTQKQVTDALQDVYVYLDTNLTVRQKQKIKFNMLLVEHALCKFSRCRTYNWV